MQAAGPRGGFDAVVVLTGSRNWTDTDVLEEMFTSMRTLGGVLYVLGDCPTGLDKLAYDIITRDSLWFPRWYADWRRLGKSAGTDRNQLMVDDAESEIVLPDRRLPSCCLGYPTETSRGTWDCLRRSRKALIRPVDVTALLRTTPSPDWASLLDVPDIQQTLL